MIFDRTNGTNRILWVRILELRRNLVQHCVLCCRLVELSFLGLDRTFSDAKYLAIFLTNSCLSCLNSNKHGGLLLLWKHFTHFRIDWCLVKDCESEGVCKIWFSIGEALVKITERWHSLNFNYSSSSHPIMKLIQISRKDGSLSY